MANAMISREREEDLFTQVVLTLINDADYYNQVKNIVELGDEFTKITWFHLRRLCPKYEVISPCEWAYVVYELTALYKLKIHTEAAMSFITRSGWCGHLSNYLRNQIPSGQTGQPEQQPEQQQPEKEDPEMEKAATVETAFETRHYVFGKDVSNLTEAELIEAIKRVEAEIAELKSIKTKSTRITAKIKELETMLAEIVKQLDTE